MKDDRLNDSQVALLCDIGSGSAPSSDISHEIGDLIERGFIERDAKDPGLHLKLTAKAQESLAARGVGISES